MSRQYAFVVTALAVSVLAAAPFARADATIGQAAPAFSVTDSMGKAQSLDAYRGKWVVLEWTNNECPFVQKHYGSGNMQKLQKTYTGQGVAWLSVISSAPGKQGYATPERANALTKERGAAPSAVLLDPEGKVGRSYAAKTTPHMFVIDPKGTLVYGGGIDDTPSTDTADIAKAKNFVAAALDAGLAGKPIATASSTPYGCSVKY
jgi:AhpC/TSA family